MNLTQDHVVDEIHARLNHLEETSPANSSMGSCDSKQEVVTDPTVQYFAGAITEFPHIDQRYPVIEPPFKGKADDFPLFDTDQFKNKVKKCGTCDKPNAYTMKSCNQCGNDLTNTEIDFSTNIFTSFIHGIQKGPFPYTVSMRHECKEYMAFDDLMSLCPCHVNIIPTTRWLPDLRYLLAKPAEGLQIVDQIKAIAHKVVKEQWLSNDAWKAKVIKDHAKYTADQLCDHLVMGFNLPPSQSQLHMQCMLPPFTPFHFTMTKQQKHFGHGRFFTHEFIRAALATGVAMAFDANTLGEDVIAFYKEQGVDYDAIHSRQLEQYVVSHELLANWSAADFSYIATNKGDGNDTLVPLNAEADPVPEDAEAVNTMVGDTQKSDKERLQNYGRPYQESGRPSGTYYSLARPADSPMPEGI